MSHAPSEFLQRRHQALRQRLDAEGLDALIVTSLPNITYLTNFVGSAAILVLSARRLDLLTDSRYVAAVEALQQGPSACPDLTLRRVDGAYDPALVSLVQAEVHGRLAVEAQHLSIARYRWLETALTGTPATLVPSEGWVERERVVKDAYELETLREGGRRLSEAATRVLGLVRANLAERDLAFAIGAEMRRVGFERPAFETIVASGPNAGLPHARPTERRLGEGDLVVLDFGGVYHSYCVDLTRTVSVGPASARSQNVHAAVRDAHDRAVEAVAPGVSRFDVDAAARNWLASAGLGDAFGHGTGHGLGLEIHEDPRVTQWRPDVDQRSARLEAGMVFTIEPGAYFPQWGGVRIEDDVVVTADGHELLTHVTTELIETD